MWYFIAFCILAVNAQNSTDSTPEQNSGSAKVEPKNISSLYIGDLLRTKPKEDLEAAGTVHRPQLLNRGLLAAASTPYKSHGGHQPAEIGYQPIYPDGRANGAAQRMGAQVPSVPFNVKGHILTLKPVRLIPADDVPASRSPGKNYKDVHYPGDDCNKNSDRSYSSEEKPYAPETYRRAKQTASNSELDYRNPPHSYYDDDRSEAYSSQSDPSSGTYSSKTYPSNTNSKSESSGSYTTSKSTSTSKTMTPNRPKITRIVPTVMSHKENYDKNYGTPYKGKGVLVYKVKEPTNQKPGSYSESSEKDYPPSDYERDQKPPVREPHYSQHSSGPRTKYTRGKQTQYSSPASKDRPQQYGPPNYEEDQDSYDQAAYTPDEDQRYREQNKPSDNYNDNKYGHQYSEKDPESKPYQQIYQSPSEEPQYSNAEQNNKPDTSRQHPNTRYGKSSKRGREQGGYRIRGHSTPEYGNSPEHQSSRDQKETPQRNYERYPVQYGPSEASPSPQYYDRTQPAPKPTEKQVNQYNYEAASPQTNAKQREIPSSYKRPYRESSRYARSPDQPTVIVERRAKLPVSGKEPVVMVSKESKPYISLSESFSESDYKMEGNKNPSANYGRQEKIQPNEGRHVSNPNYQTSYKPFNSEYPASYANDPHHNTARKSRPRAYQRPVEKPQSYNAPVYSQTDSHSGEAPQQYQQGPYQQEEAYDQGDNNEDSYEEGGKPVKKSKDHHYISNIEGYKDTYGRDEPLVIDEEFFKKYGISPTAKVIVANAENPNLFVADGSNIKEGDYFKNSGPGSYIKFGSNPDPGYGPSSGPNSGPSYESNPDPGYGPSSGPSSGPSYESNPDSGYGPSSAVSEENYDSGYKSDFKEDSYSSSPEEFGPPKQLPGSFDDLVDTNPKFLRNLPRFLKNDDSFFKMDSTEDSFDGVEFPNLGEQRGYIVSQGPREIVQQHGDGVSRIIFNVPKVESKEERSNAPKAQDKEEMESRIVEAATNLIQDIIKSDS